VPSESKARDTQHAHQIMKMLHYITHPQVEIDLGAPVAQWRLSAEGRKRAVDMLTQPWIASIGRLVSSAETKAVETARILGAHLRIDPEVRPDTGENDRSSTGALPRAEFEQLADQFFAQPAQRIRGWESARDAQQRIVNALADLLDASQPSDIAVIGHGGVGTLWYCHLAGVPIDRRHDQSSQGHYFSVDLATRRPIHGWRSID
jgi:broad specificity phosphatase PhoE